MLYRLSVLTFFLADGFCFVLSSLSCCELLRTLPGLSLESALRLGGGCYWNKNNKSQCHGI